MTKTESKRLISRRNALKGGAAGAMALGLGLDTVGAKEAKRIPIGLQLYSVRHECAKDLPKVLEAVAGMGYEGVEFAGYYDHTAKELKKLLKDNGLVCCGTHTALGTVTGDNLKATIEFNRTIGNKYLIVPSMRADSPEGWLEKARFFNTLADTLKEEKMITGYHAHAHDFKPMEGKRPWDLFFGNTKQEVVMQLDTSNCMGGGADPVEVMKQYPGRATTIHLKEFGGNAQTVLGGGDVKLKEVLALCRKGGTKWYIIEHERGGPDPIGDMKRCLEGLKKAIG